MKRLAIALIVLAASFGVSRSAKADSVTFTFISTPNSAGTYIDASGTLVGLMICFQDPCVQNAFEVESGTITVTSNLGGPGIPEFNGYSDTSLSEGGLILTNSAGGVNLVPFGFGPGGGEFGVAFDMAGNLADGGQFIFAIEPYGVNGTANNANVVGTNDGNGILSGASGTLTLYGQLGAYDLTPEPSSWLLLGSGAIFLGFLIYRRPRSGLMAQL